jgi:hypothetical protein
MWEAADGVGQDPDRVTLTLTCAREAQSSRGSLAG